METIEEFVQHYKKEYDFYEMVSKLVAQQMESSLHEAGIRAIVTYRAKNPERLLAKLYQRNEERDSKYSSLDDIYSDICDLSGVRVALYFPKDRDKVGDIIKENFTLLEEPKIFPKKKETPNYNKRFSGYWARHYRVQLKDNLLQDTQKRYVNSKTEIQVASVLMHAWSEVEHDLVYKPLNGTLSEEELAILDELNGLVLAGEIALERLQIAGTARIVKEKLFNNQYDLASYLYDKYGDKLKNKRQQLGNVELLFRLMKQCDVNTSSDLAPYLTPLTFNEDVRSLCDQISDNIIMGNDKRYMIYSELKSSDLSSDIELREAMGEFMVQWIHLEELVSKLTVNQNVRTRSPFSVNNLKRIFPDSELKKVLKLRRYRNLMVHGVEFPPVDQIKYMTNEVERVCKYLENKNKL